MDTQELCVDTLMIDIHNDLGDYGDRLCDYSGSHYLCDVITEIADNHIDGGYYELFDWAKDNYEYVEQAISEGLCDTTNPDIPKMIQAGQYVYITEDIYSHLDNSMINYCLNYLKYHLHIDTITQQQYEAIQVQCTNVDNNDTFEDYTDFLNEFIGSGAEDIYSHLDNNKIDIKTFNIDTFHFTDEAQKNAKKIINTPSTRHHNYKFELEDLIKIHFTGQEPTVQQINDFVTNEIDYITDFLLLDDNLGRDNYYTPIEN